MPKGSIELAIKRREEVISVCEKLYEKTSFKDITLKQIGDATLLGRTSIYNYFDTKEEIFLAILKKEYDLWDTDLTEIKENNEQMTAESFSVAIAHSLEKRERLLKILSMNLYDLESFSRVENLTQFKFSYKATLETLSACITKFFKGKGESGAEEFIYVFFPFLFGVYPYVFATEKQRNAMQNAGIEYKSLTIFEIIKNCVYNLLKD